MQNQQNARTQTPPLIGVAARVRDTIRKYPPQIGQVARFVNLRVLFEAVDAASFALSWLVCSLRCVCACSPGRLFFGVLFVCRCYPCTCCRGASRHQRHSNPRLFLAHGGTDGGRERRSSTCAWIRFGSLHGLIDIAVLPPLYYRNSLYQQSSIYLKCFPRGSRPGETS